MTTEAEMTNPDIAPAPDAMIGTLAAVPLPPDPSGATPDGSLYASRLQRALYDEDRIQVPIVPWPAPPARLVRITAHLYNEVAEYEALGRALVTRLDAGL